MEESVFTACDDEPTVGVFAYECEFVVESMGCLGGATEEKRVTFRGYANGEVYDVLAKAIAKVVDNG